MPDKTVTLDSTDRTCQDIRGYHWVIVKCDAGALRFCQEYFGASRSYLDEQPGEDSLNGFEPGLRTGSRNDGSSEQLFLCSSFRVFPSTRLIFRHLRQ